MGKLMVNWKNILAVIHEETMKSSRLRSSFAIYIKEKIDM